VALAGAQAHIAFSDRVIADNVGIGVAYNYFNIDGTISDPSFGGRLKMTVKGGEGFVRVGF